MLTLPLQFPRDDEYRLWTGLYGSGISLAIAETVKQHIGVVLVITPDSATAARIEEEVGFFLGGDDQWPLLHFPDRETLPYDQFSPHQDILSNRLRTLSELPRLKRGLVVAAAATLAVRLPPKAHLLSNSLTFRIGQKIDINVLRLALEGAGYRSVDAVYEHGEFAVRGAIIDLFPMGTTQPVRIELFDEDIETLRLFDPETQRSATVIEQLELLPARECPLDRSAVRRFRDGWAERFSQDPRRCSLYQDVVNGLHSPGLEYYLPLFFEETSSFFDYLPENALALVYDDLASPLRHYWQEIRDRHEELCHDNQRPILPPADVFLPENQFFEKLNRLPKVILRDHVREGEKNAQQFLFCAVVELPVQPKSESPYQLLQLHLAGDAARRILFCAESAGRREALMEQLSRANLRPTLVSSWQEFLEHTDRLCLTVAELERGLWLDRHEIIAEAQLFGGRVMQRRRRKASSQDFSDELVIRNLAELKPGAPVVHVDHGVGRYQGLMALELDGQTQEFLLLEYADQAKLYVPVNNLHLIARYAGNDDSQAPLHRLGTDQWQKAKRKAAEEINDVAAELLNIYARRAAREGYRYHIDAKEYELFASGFPFEETADQAAAIQATISDMASSHPMDRLVCGDVGFGKTEVAMRAAFLAIQNGKQVAVLVPTTLLAQQHYETFKDRFADWPVRIEVLSRFRTTKEQNTALEQLADGRIDIVIGTHKLLQPDLKFQRLGLIIVDEEHRFGVRHKEALKSLRTEVDMLTLTATPIPRTLNMALSGLRDLSIIATPPAKRLAIKTFVRESNPAVIKEAVLRELLRGGQVYYLHNEVETIDKCAGDIGALIPEARIGIAHGQMRERELEHVMQQFYHKQFNVLVCTTIIETGIDIPSANTIIMDRADKLGLAQLHQLRGRVGRSHHQAYAYLLTPHRKAMAGDAEKRLEAISQADELGAGFSLASHDLEIRGAGELLGEEQSGNMQSVGYTLYMEMLERAVDAIRKGKAPNLDKPLALTTEVNLRLPALIPSDYLPDVHLRLILYKRIASARNTENLQELQIEMIDRFGLLPDALKNLYAVTQLKLQAEVLGIEKIDAGPAGGRIDFGPDTKVDPRTLIALIQKSPKTYKLDGGTRLKFLANLEENNPRIQFVSQLMTTLGGG